MKKNKKPLWITLISLDVVITVFLFVISILMLITMPKGNVEKLLFENRMKTEGPSNLIEFFQYKSTLYLIVGVIPLFLLLIANIVILYIYIKKSSEKKKIALNELSAEQKEALRKELLKDLANQNAEEK